MDYLVVAHRSRAHTLRLFEILSSYGIYCKIVNTPKEAGVGCGLSVRVDTASLNTVRRIVLSVSMPSFAGIFLVKRTSNGQIVRSI